MNCRNNDVILNESLIKKQGIGQDEVDMILDLHSERVSIERDMKALPSDSLLQDLLNDKWMIVQKQLQYWWGFDINDNYIKFWEVPHCKCPKMDNNDRYPNGMYYLVADCPIHGSHR